MFWSFTFTQWETAWPTWCGISESWVSPQHQFKTALVFIPPACTTGKHMLCKCFQVTIIPACKGRQHVRLSLSNKSLNRCCFSYVLDLHPNNDHYYYVCLSLKLFEWMVHCFKSFLYSTSFSLFETSCFMLSRKSNTDEGTQCCLFSKTSKRRWSQMKNNMCR